jgi:flap endonuclease-1
MGIKGLTKLLQEKAPKAIKEKKFKEYFGQKVAIDASMSLYQFLIAIRHGGDSDSKYNYQNLTTESGEVTSHLQGMFYRAIRLLDAGIKPAYIFDGKPEALKSSELNKRREAKQKAQKQLEEAREAGRQEDVEKFTKSSTVVTQQQYDDVKKLLTLMGLPIVQAPGVYISIYLYLSHTHTNAE